MLFILTTILPEPASAIGYYAVIAYLQSEILLLLLSAFSFIHQSLAFVLQLLSLGKTELFFSSSLVA